MPTVQGPLGMGSGGMIVSQYGGYRSTAASREPPEAEQQANPAKTKSVSANRIPHLCSPWETLRPILERAQHSLQHDAQDGESAQIEGRRRLAVPPTGEQAGQVQHEQGFVNILEARWPAPVGTGEIVSTTGLEPVPSAA